VQPLAQGWVGWGSDGSVLVTRMGWLTRTQHVVPHARVQSVALQQGPLLRRLRLASVAVHTTQALAVNAALHLDAYTARALLFAESRRASGPSVK
jgi:putative membrane protein